jgi:AraC-like DNA-binding protein
MNLVSVVPAAPLSGLVQQLWDWQAAPQADGLERLLPMANAALIINLSEDESRVYDDNLHCRRYLGAALDGPRHLSSIIDTREQVAVMGVVFRAGAAAGFFRERMDALVNRCVNLEDLVGSDAGSLRERLLEAGDASRRLRTLLAWLIRRGPDALAVPDPVAHALSALEQRPAIATLTATARDRGVSPRRLGEQFREHVGMTPKRYLRLQRFQRVLAQAAAVGERDWADIALACGYFDQAHLSHEFREFCGMSPTEFARRGRWQRHIALQ